MKRLIAILLAVMVLTAVFTACSGTAYYDDGRGYGNVSTTPNGRVNGGENYYGTTGGAYGQNARGTYNGTYNGGMTNGSTVNGGMTNNSRGTNGVTGTGTGAGMTGGR